METLTKKGPGRPPMEESLAVRKQEEILDGAARVFASQGFSGADLQVIADELGIAKGTIYRYFPSKRDLFIAAVNRVMRLLRTQIDQDIAGLKDPLSVIEGGVRSYLRFFDANPQFTELIIQERAQFKERKQPTYFQQCEANVQPWRELFEGLIASDRVRNISVDRIMDVISNLVSGTMFSNYFMGSGKSFESQTQDIIDVLLRGILSEAERKL